MCHKGCCNDCLSLWKFALCFMVTKRQLLKSDFLIRKSLSRERGEKGQGKGGKVVLGVSSR